MQTPDLLGCIKRSDIEIVQIRLFLIERSELIGFGYDLSNTQDGLRLRRNGIYILWLTTHLVTRIQVSDPGPKGPLVCFSLRFCRTKSALFLTTEKSYIFRISFHLNVKQMSRNKLRQPSLTINAPITTKVVCFSRLLICLRSIYGKQCGPRSDCSYRSSLFWVHAVCFYSYSSVMLGNYLQQTTSADDIFRCIFF